MCIDNSKNCTESETNSRLSEILNFSLLIKYNKITRGGELGNNTGASVWETPPPAGQTTANILLIQQLNQQYWRFTTSEFKVNWKHNPFKTEVIGSRIWKHLESILNNNKTKKILT